MAVVMLFLAANAVAAGLLAFTIFFYVVIYTMWLKRSTPQNIVIGGAAGAFPPMIGWAVATGGVSLEAVLMFALTFAWTPPHFWALALFVKTDYADAKVPMLTVTHGRDATRRQILGYTLALAVVSLALGLTSIGGPIYMAVAVVLNALFIRRRLGHPASATTPTARPTSTPAERKFFKLSLAYLFLHFGALLVEATLAPWSALGRLVTWPRTIRAEHELHRRRLSRNVGLGVVLVLFVGLVYGLTIAKVGTDPNDALGMPGTEASQ